MTALARCKAAAVITALGIHAEFATLGFVSALELEVRLPNG